MSDREPRGPYDNVPNEPVVTEPTDVEATVAEPEPAESEVADVQTAPEAPHLVLELEGDRAVFRCRGQKANQFLLVKYVDALASTGFAATNAVTRLALGQVERSEQARLEAYLEGHGYDPNYDDALFAALDACWRGETMLPFASPSHS